MSDPSTKPSTELSSHQDLSHQLADYLQANKFDLDEEDEKYDQIQYPQISIKDSIYAAAKKSNADSIYEIPPTVTASTPPLAAVPPKSSSIIPATVARISHSAFTSFLPTYASLTASSSEASSTSSTPIPTTIPSLGPVPPSTNSTPQFVPLRVPLLEESNRLLRAEILDLQKQQSNYKSQLLDMERDKLECKEEIQALSNKNEAYKSQLYALEKIKLDLREDLRCTQEELTRTKETLEDRRFAEQEQQREINQFVENLHQEIAKRDHQLSQTSKALAQTQDELYQTRTALSDTRKKQVEQLELERVWKMEVEAELKKQIRLLCVERNQAQNRCQQLTSDLSLMRSQAKLVQSEKQELFEQLYATSRLAKETPRECASPEQVLLNLQKTEIKNLTSRLQQFEDEMNERLKKMREEVASSESTHAELRAKNDALEEALKKCMNAMDVQKDELDAERKQLKHDRMKFQEEQRLKNTTAIESIVTPQIAQPQTQPTSHPTTAVTQPTLPTLTQPPVPTQTTAPSLPQQQQQQPQSSEQQQQPVTLPPVVELNSPSSIMTSSVQSTAPVESPQTVPTTLLPSAAAAIQSLSSQEILHHTQWLQQQELAANERRKQIRLERKLALEKEQQLLQMEEQKYQDQLSHRSIALAANQPIATTLPPLAAVVKNLDLTKVPSYAGPIAPTSVSTAPILITAEPSAITAPPQSSPLPPVTFDFTYMDEMPSFKPITVIKPNADTTVKPSTTVEEKKDEISSIISSTLTDPRIQVALQLAIREVELDRQQRPETSDPSTNKSDQLDPNARLAAALELLASRIGQETSASHTTAQSSSGTAGEPSAVAAAAIRAKIKANEARKKMGVIDISNKENVYQPAAEILIAAGEDVTESDESGGQGMPLQSRDINVLAPLKRPVPKLTLPTSTAPSIQPVEATLVPPAAPERLTLIQRAIATAQADSSSRPSSSRSTGGKSVGSQSNSQRSNASTSSSRSVMSSSKMGQGLKNIAASLKKHKKPNSSVTR